MTRADLARVFLRLLFIQASLHRRGMQNLGLMHALQATPLAEGDTRRVARHAEYFNTNPNTAPLVVGGVIRIEEEGDATARASVSRFKQAAGSALAAVGDVVFVGGLKPLALTLACVSAIYSFFPGLVAVLLLYNGLVLACRYRGLTFGYARGWGLIEAFSGVRVQRLIGTVRGVAGAAGGALVGVIAWTVWDDGRVEVAILAGVVALGLVLSKRVTPARVAILLFPLSWLAALLTK